MLRLSLETAADVGDCVLLSVDSVTPPLALPWLPAALFVAGIGLVVPPALSALDLLLLLLAL